MQFVGVAWYGDDTSFQEFVDKHGLTFAQISDEPAVVFTRFGVSSQPAIAIIDKTGAVQVSLGAVDGDSLDAALTAVTAG